METELKYKMLYREYIQMQFKIKQTEKQLKLSKQELMMMSTQVKYKLKELRRESELLYVEIINDIQMFYKDLDISQIKLFKDGKIQNSNLNNQNERVKMMLKHSSNNV